MRASKLLKLPVMAMREGLEQGWVVDLVVDPEKKRVSHYIVQKESRYDLLLLSSSDIRGIGTGYLVVPDSSVVRRIYGDARRMEIITRGFFLTDAIVISDAGIGLGTIVDYDFDPRTGNLSTLLMENGAQYPAAQIVGLSGNTVFVNGIPPKGSTPTVASPQHARTTSPSASAGAAAPSVMPASPAPAMSRPAASPVSAPSQVSTQVPQVSTPEPQTTQQHEPESLVVSPIPPAPTPPGTGSFTRPAPSVSAQLRNAYKPEPVVPVKADSESSSDSLAAKAPNVMRRLLVGKRLADGVTSEDGIFTLPAGTVITEWHMQLAEQHDAVQQLMRHVEPS